MKNKQRVSAALVKKWIPVRSPGAHKGSVGRVFIVAGSRGMSGAAILTALGALRSGAGLIKVGVPESQQNVLAKKGPLEITTMGFRENVKGQFLKSDGSKILKSISLFQAHVAAVGPGLGVSSDLKNLVQKLFTQLEIPLVLDADGINSLSLLKKIPASLGPRLITPHPGELSRFLGRSIQWIQTHRTAAACLGARKIGGICLLKGKGTIVTDGEQVFINTTGNSKMASGGMGDLLTGVIASLWAQSGDFTLAGGFRSAALGAYWHGLAGDLAAKKIGGISVSASEVAQFLPEAFKKI